MLFKVSKNYLKLIFDDKKKIFSLLILPVILFTMGMLIYKVFNKDSSRKVALAYEDKDNSEFSKYIIESLDKEKYILLDSKGKDLRSFMKGEDIPQGIIIDKDFEKNILNKKENKIVFIARGDLESSTFIKRSINAVVNHLVGFSNASNLKDSKSIVSLIKSLDNKVLKTTFTKVKTLPYYNELSGAVGFGLIILTSSIISNTSLILESKLDNTFYRIKTTKAPAYIVVFGIIISATIVLLAQIVSFYILTTFVFQARLSIVASIYMFLFGLAIILLSTAFYVGTNSLQAAMLLSNTSFIFALLGSSVWPFAITPKFIKTIASITPHHWVNKGIYEMNKGFNINSFYSTCAVLLAFIIFGFTLSIYLYKKSETSNDLV